MYFSSMWNQNYLWPLPNTPEAEPMSASINLSLGNSKTTEGGLSVHIEHIFMSIYSEICSYICNIILNHTEFKHKPVSVPILFSPKEHRDNFKRPHEAPKEISSAQHFPFPCFLKPLSISSKITISCFLLSPLSIIHILSQTISFLSPNNYSASNIKDAYLTDTLHK